MLRSIAIGVAAAAIGWAIAALAQPRADLRPPVVPVASSSSNGASFAWFYDPAERAVILCRSGAGDGIDCKSRTNLP